jgi:hypothetical protein
MAKGKTQKYYDKNPAANKRRLKQQSKYQKTAKGKKLKADAARDGLKIGSKKGDGKDVCHVTVKGKRKAILCDPKKNRAKKGKHA